jgi:hypothetical protein
MLEQSGSCLLYMTDSNDQIKTSFCQTDTFKKYPVEFIKEELLKVGFSEIQMITSE